jgi:hypothetical protein
MRGFTRLFSLHDHFCYQKKSFIIWLGKVRHCNVIGGMTFLRLS